MVFCRKWSPYDLPAPRLQVCLEQEQEAPSSEMQQSKMGVKHILLVEV